MITPLDRIRPPDRDPDYLAWVRRQNCALCDAPWPSDPHHVVTGGVGQRCSDHYVCPLCRPCHNRVQASKATYMQRMLREALSCLGRYVVSLNTRVTAFQAEKKAPEHGFAVTQQPGHDTPIRVAVPEGAF